MKTLKHLLIIGIVSLGLYSFTKLLQEKWDIPEKYVKMKNPTYANQENLAIGKTLYNKHCMSCHGKTGIGDGPKAGEFDTNIGDFSSKEFHQQSEGEIFYKSYIGRRDMPNYEKEIPDPKNMWFIVNYLKTLEEFLKTQKWDIPKKYVKMKNPTYANKENLAIGKALYIKHCKSCHGKTGIGDGPKAGEFDTDIGDFSSKEFHEQTEGEIFYKSYIGRHDMPNYEKKIPDAKNMWFIVNYLKTLEEFLKTQKN